MLKSPRLLTIEFQMGRGTTLKHILLLSYQPTLRTNQLPTSITTCMLLKHHHVGYDMSQCSNCEQNMHRCPEVDAGIWTTTAR